MSRYLTHAVIALTLASASLCPPASGQSPGAWRSLDQVIGIELAAGTTSLFNDGLSDAFGTGFASRAALHASLSPHGHTWMSWSVGFRHDSGDFYGAVLDDTFELDSTPYTVIPTTIGIYLDTTARGRRESGGYPVALHLGAGMELAWVHFDQPDDDPINRFAYGVYLEMFPAISLTDNYRAIFRSKLSLLSDAGSDGTQLNFSGLQLELGLIRRIR